MCDGGDILKVAALGTLAYFAGPAAMSAMGGGGAGAVAGEGVGAAAGTMAAANAAGAAGGDALGTLIAGNAANWGVSVAPELIGAGAGIAAGAGGGGAGAGGGAAAGPVAGAGTTLSKVAQVAAITNAGMGLLAGKQGAKTPPPPSLLAPIVMPTTDDLATQRARAAMLSTLSQRRGRTSTILSNDSLGGN